MNKILVIEDTLFILKSVADMLKKSGFDVLTASDGVHGIDIAKSELPNLILCDIDMPELNGYEVLNELSKSSQTNLIPFIFMSATKIDLSEIRYGMSLGADDYIIKPFTNEELVTAINSRLEKHKRFIEHSEKRLENLRKNIIYSLPHEFRTPLTTMMMTSSLLNDRADLMKTDDIKKMARRMNKSAKRLHRLIENFLLYMQINSLSHDEEKIKYIQAKSTAEPKKIISQVCLMKAEEVGRKDDLIIEKIENAGIKISSDNLEKIITEIIDNAFKFSKENTKVVVKTYKSNDVYTIRIKDHGRGMTVEQISKIGAYMQFERKIYEQQGSGFGLIIAKKLVELHLGTLTINSEYEYFTEIEIRFKIVDKA